MEIVYKKRIADGLLQRKLAGKGAVLIEGAKLENPIESGPLFPHIADPR